VTKSAACSHTRSVLQSRDCFRAGNDDEVAACRTLRTLYCATVNLSSLSYFDISQKSPRQKGSFHILQPRFVTYKGTIRALHICHSAPKKREKNRGMPHLEKRALEPRAAAIAIGRQNSPEKTTNREPNMNMYERERQRETERARAEGLTHSHYCLSRLDTLAWPFLLCRDPEMDCSFSLRACQKSPVPPHD
jgi:hypothetical protein